MIEPAVTRDHTERMLLSFGCRVDAAHGEVRLTPPAAAAKRARSKCRATFRPRRSSWSPARSAAATAHDHGVGINPTRTGLLDILAPDGRGSAGRQPSLRRRRAGRGHRSAAGAAAGHPRARASGAAGDRRVPGAVRRRRLRRGRDGRDRRRGAAREGKRPHRRDGGRPDARWACDCEVLPDGIRIQGRPERRGVRRRTVDSHGDHRIAMSFAVASCARAGADPDPRRGQRRDLVSRTFPDVARAAGLRRARSVSESRSAGAADHHHRRAQRFRQGHDLAGWSRTGWAGICSTAARCIGWWPTPGSSAGSRRDDEAGHAAIARDLDVSFGLAPDGGEQIWLDGDEVSQRDPDRAGGRGRLAGRGHASGPGGAAGPPAAFAGPPGLVADGRDMGTVIFPGAPPQDLPDGQRRGAGAPAL